MTSAGQACRIIVVLLAVLFGAGCNGKPDPLNPRSLPDALPEADYTPRPDARLTLSGARGRAMRRDALKRARVWRAPDTPIELANLGSDEGDPSTLACRFLPTSPSGTSAKFDCVLPGGEIVKVKYGSNPEIGAEVAASRLLRALGFGADRVFVAAVVHCFGCPLYPFNTSKLLERTGMIDAYTSRIDYGEYVDFKDVSVEYRSPGRALVVDDAKGWAWWELDEVQRLPPAGNRSDVDAFRLLALFLAHWDNKAENQRLVCLGDDLSDACDEPLALIQDAGATFGPWKADLDPWTTAPIWVDRARCEIGMESLPHAGGTFQPGSVSEGGRLLLAGLLRKLSARQIRDLFQGAHITSFQPFYNSRSGRDLDGWVAAFLRRVGQVADGPPCP